MKKEIKPKLGRPFDTKKKIDTNLLYELARIHCTKEEIANILGCHRDTIYANYSDILQRAADEGKSSLRRLQWKSAESGNVNMQIWLGKQWLGQKDKQPEELENTVINVKINEVPK